jgi:hypothetical protein
MNDSVVKEISKEGILTIYPEGVYGPTIQEFNIKGMTCPVICSHCGKVYDLHIVKVNHRFMDCTQFTTPCCNYQFADDRECKSFKDYERLLE